jgi:hypothetical protein
MAVRTPSELRDLIPVILTPSPGKVYASHIRDIIDSFEAIAASPIINLTGSHAATVEQANGRFFINSATPVNFTVPSTAPVGYQGLIVQVGAGAITVLGGTLLSRESHNKTAGQGAQAFFVVYSNPGSAPLIALSGDTAP